MKGGRAHAHSLFAFGRDRDLAQEVGLPVKVTAMPFEMPVC